MDANDAQPWLALAGVVGAVAALIAALHALRKRRLIEMLPTSTTDGVFIGLVELKGAAGLDPPLRSRLAEIDCVYYVWSVDERWSRTVTETVRDEKGNTSTRTRTESGWTTVASGGEQAPFRLRDERGEIQVRPAGAEIQALAVFDRTCGRWDDLYYAKGPATAIGDSDHRRRFHERAIPVGQALYVIGQARERADCAHAEIAYDAAAPLFVISTRPESAVAAGLAWAVVGWSLAGAVAAGLAGAVVDASRAGGYAPDASAWLAQRPTTLAALGGFAACWAFGWTLTLFNALINLRQRVRQAWANIDIQLKRRADLIPRLVAIVSALADHERTVQTELAALRAQALTTAPGRAGPDFARCATTIGVIAQRYPSLIADRGFADLQRAIVECEDRIALARGYYNDIAAFANTWFEAIPSRWIARLGGIRAQPLLAAEAAAASAPRVDGNAGRASASAR